MLKEIHMNALNSSVPRKLYVELATLCNLHCAMCVKHSAGWECTDALMERRTFEALSPVFPHLETLNLNGVGESMLHPELPGFIEHARGRVPDGCMVGFQSNGMLLTPALADRLVASGLDRICFSVDSPDPAELGRFRAGSELDRVSRAFALMRRASSLADARPLTLGAQTVVNAQTHEALPDMVSWCADRDADFVIVSHVLPYNAADTSQSLFVFTSQRCLDFYNEWKKVFEAEGMDVSHSYQAFYAVFRTPKQQRQVEIILAMKEQAQRFGLQFSLPNVMGVDLERMERVRNSFTAAAEVAEKRGVRLQLPELAAREPRECPFVAEPSLFVACEGALTPCYFLWHSYSAWSAGGEIRVKQRVFGRVPQDDPMEVWSRDEFARFRAEALNEEYARCGDCSVAPCDHVQGVLKPFEKDCYGQGVPCGICPWSGGGFACLQ